MVKYKGNFDLPREMGYMLLGGCEGWAVVDELRTVER